jgi:putative ABC transport system permease protein
MIRNYFKTTWRNLLRDGQFTLLNLIGLSAGLTCVLLIYMWVGDELNVDRFNTNDSHLYQVIKNSPNADGTIYTSEATQGRLAETMEKELPEVEYAVSVRPENVGVISSVEKHIRAVPDFVDKNFFKIFSYRIIDGNKTNPFFDKSGVLISNNLALKLFNTTTNLVGKTIEWHGGGEFDGPYKISGVYEGPPQNATHQFDFLFSYEEYATKESTDMAYWGSNGMYTYLLLKDGVNIDQFNKKIKYFTQEKIKDAYKGDSQLKYLLQWEGSLFLQRFSDKYLHNHYENGIPSGGRIEYVKLFSLIAVFVLLIACINFMNLSTAKASGRFKEVGIRKVIGARRHSLIIQFIGESLLMAFLSLALTFLFVKLLLPAFREITGKEISLHFNTGLILSAIGITAITGLIAGSYPAFYLSGFRPAMVLKGKLNNSSGDSSIRKVLVVFQFSITVILIVSVLIVYKQMKLIQNKNLGYNKDNVVVFSNEGKLRKNLSPFFAELRKIPGIINVSDIDGNFLGNASHAGSGINWEGKDPGLGIEYYGNGIDLNFFETMGMQIAEGRAFSENYDDSSSVIFNQSAIKAMGIKNPVGKTVSLWGKTKQIVGVVKDYHFQSMYKKISPAFLTYATNNENTLVKIKAGTERQTISSIKDLYSKFNDNLNFNYSFMNDDYNALYASEQRVAKLSGYFAAMAILISCLGLFGLSAFAAQKRQKEIGIRKVVGASVSNIATMLSADFLKLILISLLIAIPVSWWGANAWLNGFAYRVNTDVAIFLITGSLIIVIALITISFQAIKAAVANPVNSLRAE